MIGAKAKAKIKPIQMKKRKMLEKKIQKISSKMK